MPDYTLSAKGTFDGSNFNSGLAKSTSALENFANKCKSVGNSGSSSLSKFMGVAAKVGGIVSGLATGAFMKGGIDRALNIEQAQYKLRQLGLDVEAIMKSANEAVTGTAHSLDAAATTASSLAASGVQAGDDMTRSLQAVAGMATIAGRDMSQIGLIFGKVAAQGRLQGDELMQFAESGINATDALSKALGKSQTEVREMVRAGQIDFQTFSDAMFQAFGKAAYGANETFTGALSNVQAALSRFSAKFATPALDGMKRIFQELIPTINGVSEASDPLVAKWTELVNMASDRGVSALRAFSGTLADTNDPIMALKAAVQDLFGPDIAQAFESIATGFTSVGSLARDAVQWFLSLDAGTQQFIATLAAAGLAFRPLVSGFAQITGGVAGFIGKMSAAGKSVVDFGNKANNAFKNLGAGSTGNIAKGLDQVTTAAKKTGPALNGVTNKVSMLAKATASGNIEINKTSTAFKYQDKQIASYGSNIQKMQGYYRQMTQGVAAAEPTFTRINNTIQNSGTKMKAVGTEAKSLSANIKTISSGATAASSGIQQVGTASQTATTGMRLAGAAAGILKTALASIGVGLAITGITMIAEKFISYADAVKTAQGAITGFSSAMDAANASYGPAASSLNKVTQATTDVMQSSKDALKAQGDLAAKFTKSWQEAGNTESVLRTHIDTINRLGNKYDEFGNRIHLSAQDQAELVAAISAVNSICGTNYSVIDASTGALDASTEAINRNAEAWINNAKAQAAQEELVEVEKQRIQNQKEIKAVREALNKAEQEGGKGLLVTAEGLKDIIGQETLFGIALEDIIPIADEQGMTIHDLSKRLQELEESDASAAEYQKFLEDILRDTQIQGEQTAAAIKDISEALSGTDWFASWAENSGRSLDEVATKLNDFGLTAADVSTMSADFLTVLSENWDGSMQGIIDACNEAGVAVPESLRTAMQESATVLQEEGAVVVEQADAVIQQFGKSLQQLEDEGLIDSLGRVYDEFGNVIGQVEGYAQQIGDATGEIQDTTSENLGGASEEAVDKAQQINDALHSIASDSSSVIDNLRSTFDGLKDEFTAIGTSLGNSLSTGFNQADMASTASKIDEMVAAVSGREGEFNSVGVSLGNALSTGISQADMASSATAVETAISVINGMMGLFNDSGIQSGQQYASGISGASGEVSGAAQSLVSSAESALASAGDTAYSSGSHLGSQFAAGIESQVGAVSAAASALAAAAAAYIEHTKPDKGPLSQGEEIFGEHLGQNFAAGIASQTSTVGIATAQLAQVVVNTISTGATTGPLAGGTWVFGKEIAIDYSEGLRSSSSLRAVSDAVSDIGDVLIDELEEIAEEAEDEAEEDGFDWMAAYIDAMIASYRGRSGELKQVSTDIGDLIWGAVNPAVMAKDWMKPVTGSVYESMKILEEAGYDLDSFKDKLDNIKPDDKDYADWIALNEKLTASYDDLAHWQSFYKLKDNVITGIDSTKNWTNILDRFADHLGNVNFSETFLDAVVGVEDYEEALSQLADMSDEAIQEMVDSYDDLARAEREQELAQRSLWVNSLAAIQSSVPNAKDWLLDFRETCLDVKEAIYSDRGLNIAFQQAGVSVEEFALNLRSMGVDMSDFLGFFDDFVSDVTNGFSQMTKANQTTFEDWKKNLQLNMAESASYASNLQKVMGKISPEIDSEAFRRAVYEGGFSQWGRVIADMASMSASEVAQAVQLYNAAILEAEQSAIEQFNALSNGSEYLTNFLQDAGFEQMPEMMGLVGNETLNVVKNFEGSFFEAATGLTDAMASGILEGGPQVGEAVSVVMDGITDSIGDYEGHILAVSGSIGQSIAEGISQAVSSSDAVSILESGQDTWYNAAESLGISMTEGLASTAPALTETTQDLMENVAMDILRYKDEIESGSNSIGKAITSGISSSIAESANETYKTISTSLGRISDAVEQVSASGPVVKDAFKAILKADDEFQYSMIYGVIQGIEESQDDFNEAVLEASDEARRTMLETYPQWVTVGYTLGEGIAAGMRQAMSIINSAAKDVVDSAVNSAFVEAVEQLEIFATSVSAVARELTGGKGLVSYGTSTMQPYAAISPVSTMALPASYGSYTEVNPISSITYNGGNTTIYAEVRNDQDIDMLAAKIARADDRRVRELGGIL